MRGLWLAFLFACSLAHAEIGKVTKLIGAQDAYLIRAEKKIILTPDMSLDEGDELFSQGSVVLTEIFPASQMSLAKNSRVKLVLNQSKEENGVEENTAVIDFVTGMIRMQINKDKDLKVDQKISARDVVIGVRGTEFEVSETEADVDLDVVEGEVEVSSPYVQTFVPEIVKANEGFRFNRRAHQFSRRQFRLKFQNHPGFARREEIKARRLERRRLRRELRQGAPLRQTQGRAERILERRGERRSGRNSRR